MRQLILPMIKNGQTILLIPNKLPGKQPAGMEELNIIKKGVDTIFMSTPFGFFTNLYESLYRNFGSFRPSFRQVRYSAVAAKRTSPEEFSAVSSES